METAARLERYLAIDSVVAWRVLGLTFQSRDTPEMSCEAFLDRDDWQALACYRNHTVTPPQQPPTLKQTAHWIAQLGGFLGRKGDGDPSVTDQWLERSFTRMIACAVKIDTGRYRYAGNLVHEFWLDEATGKHDGGTHRPGFHVGQPGPASLRAEAQDASGNGVDCDGSTGRRTPPGAIVHPGANLTRTDRSVRPDTGVTGP